MKKFMSILLALFVSTGSLFAQEGPSGKEKLSKKELRKLEKKKERENNLAFYKEVAEEKAWVIEAHTIFNKYGRSLQMDPTINFVSVAGDETIIQLGFHGAIGYNGLGGVTLDGMVNNYEVKRDGDSILITYTAMGAAIGPVDMLARISPDGYGRITLSGNWGRRLTFAGYFVPYDTSRTYTGTPVY